MNNKIVSSKTTSAIFLAIVLVTGTIAISFLSSSSFITADAQVQPYSDGIDYNNYKISKDNSKSNTISINKIKCINDNLNINGRNAGDVNLGNKGQAGEGYLGANSYSGEGYYNGHGKKDKGFDCIINNNNTNINLVGGGNQTEPLTCEECFTENLSPEQLNNLTSLLSRSPLVVNLEGLCEQLSNATLTNQQKLLGLAIIFAQAGITDEDAFLRVLECLDELGLIIVPPDFGLPNSMR